MGRENSLGNVVFNCDGKDEIFDTSAKAFLRASGIDFPGVPGLSEVGIKATSGKVFLFNKISKLELIKKEPAETFRAAIYEGIEGDRLEIDLHGKTKVIRVDVDLVGYGRKTFWKRFSPE